MLSHFSRVQLCSPPGSSVHGIFQARTLEWVAIFFSRVFPTQGLNSGTHFGQTLYSLNREGIPTLHGWILFHCTDISQYIYLFKTLWKFGLFPFFFAIVNGAALNIYVHIFLNTCFQFSDYIIRSGIAGLYSNSILNFLRNWQLFSTWLYYLTFHWQCK